MQGSREHEVDDAAHPCIVILIVMISNRFFMRISRSPSYAEMAPHAITREKRAMRARTRSKIWPETCSREATGTSDCGRQAARYMDRAFRTLSKYTLT